MNCQKCGKPLPEGATSCPACHQPQMAFCCPRCQTPISADTTLCPGCGLQMQPYVTAPAPSQSQKSGVPKGLLIALIAVFGVGLLIVGALIAWLLHGSRMQKPDAPVLETAAPTETQVLTDEPTHSADEESHISLDPAAVPDSNLPYNALVRTGAVQEDLVGDWEGTFIFTALNGTAFGDGPEQLIGREIPAELHLGADGSWSLYMEAFSELVLEDSDFEPEDQANAVETSAHLWKGPDHGSFTIAPPTMTDESGSSGTFSLTGSIADDADGVLLAGEVVMDMRMSDGTGYLRGNLLVRPEDAVPEGSLPDASSPMASIPSISTDTVEHPVPGDFAWFENFTDIPADVRYLDLGEYFGTWKGMIIHDETVRSLLNVTIDAGQSDILVRFDWYQVWYNGEEPAPMEAEDTVLSGYHWGNGILAKGDGTVELEEFYERNGKQYAVGTFRQKDGRTAKIALVR